MQNENDENQHNQHVPGGLPALPMERETELQPAQQQLSRREAELKIRCGSFLSKLESDQTQQLFRWLQEHSAPKVRLLVAAPAPEGFGLEVQETTLRRLRAHLRAGAAHYRLSDSAELAAELNGTVEEVQPRFAPIVTELLLEKAFELARLAPTDPELKPLIASVVKLRELELKTQRLQLQREHLSLSTSTRRHRVDLNIIPPAGTRRIHPADSPRVLSIDSPAGQLAPAAGREAPDTDDHRSE